jgi:tRNA(Ile)-lysidine synthase
LAKILAMSTTISPLFFSHVRRFLDTHNPRRSRRVVLAVSGGLDSMMLMELANQGLRNSWLDEARVLTVDHGTRPGQAHECERVKLEADRRELPCEILRLTEAAPTSDIEATLRQRRHAALKAALQPGEDLWLGHHLDDSWEWVQMQSLRSSTPALGIPLRHGPILRPFLCVTRRQIRRCARELGVRWVNDPTNQDARLERNWWRLFARPLYDRHPQHLKHYARRSQALADELGLALRRFRGEVWEREEATLVRGDISPLRWARLVARHSGVTRGRVQGELQKLQSARLRGRRGPHSLSGGVKIHMWGEWTLVTSHRATFADHKVGEVAPREWARDEFARAFETQLARARDWSQAPFWVAFPVEQNSRNALVAAGRDVSWPIVTSGESAVISAFKLLERWKDPGLRLLLAPLWNA